MTAPGPGMTRQHTTQHATSTSSHGQGTTTPMGGIVALPSSNKSAWICSDATARDGYRQGRACRHLCRSIGCLTPFLSWRFPQRVPSPRRASAHVVSQNDSRNRHNQKALGDVVARRLVDHFTSGRHRGCHFLISTEQSDIIVEINGCSDISGTWKDASVDEQGDVMNSRRTNDLMRCVQSVFGHDCSYD
jgi:hypothetical protein